MRTIQFDRARFQLEGPEGWLMLRVPPACRQPARAFVHDMKQDKLYEAQLQPRRGRRSLDANRYFWLLCGKLAMAIGESKEAIYRGYVRELGDNFYFKSVQPEEVARFQRIWSGGRAGWFCEQVGPSQRPGEVELICYYGSSYYDTRQMSRLIDLVVQDCRDQDIETMTPEELALLKEDWEHAPDDQGL